MANSMYWYDFETTGINPGRDRAIQFAGVRTDEDLNVIGEPLDLLCYPGEDTIPAPEAILVTGINMMQLKSSGMNEAEFSRQIHEQFSTPETCVVGFNSLRFDDEFTRYLFYRNFYDPYAREWQSGNSRWDVIDMFRMAHALRPEGINWPVAENGNVTFRLEKLTEENGIGHENAHDALSDIEATISLAKLVKTAQPKLFDYHFQMRKKQPVLDLLYPLGKAPVLLIQPFFDSSDRYLAPILPLLAHPSNQNSIICLDLRQDPEAYCSLTGDALTDYLLPKRVEGERSKPSVVQRIQINRCPPIAPMNTLPTALAADLSWSLDALTGFVKKIQSHPGIQGALIDALRRVPEAPAKDAEFQLYSGGFVSEVDRSRFAQVHETASSPGQTEVFEEARLNELLFTFKARHYPDSLDAVQAQRWRDFLSARWQRDARLSALYLTTRARLAAEPDSILLLKLLRRLQWQASLISLTLD